MFVYIKEPEIINPPHAFFKNLIPNIKIAYKTNKLGVA